MPYCMCCFSRSVWISRQPCGSWRRHTFKNMHVANFGRKALSPHANILQNLTCKRYFTMFAQPPRLCSLTEATPSAKGSFCMLKLIKNFLRTNLKQERLTYFAMLSIKSEFVRTADFKDIINNSVNLMIHKEHFF